VGVGRPSSLRKRLPGRLPVLAALPASASAASQPPPCLPQGARAALSRVPRGCHSSWGTSASKTRRAWGLSLSTVAYCVGWLALPGTFFVQAGRPLSVAPAAIRRPPWPPPPGRAAGCSAPRPAPPPAASDPPALVPMPCPSSPTIAAGPGVQLRDCTQPQQPAHQRARYPGGHLLHRAQRCARLPAALVRRGHRAR
jgi:hypothetical protein